MKPTPLELLDSIEMFTGKDSRWTPEWNEAHCRLMRFLSLPAVQALADPKLAAAAAVVIEKLPELIEMVEAQTASALVCDAAGTAVYFAYEAAKASEAATPKRGQGER